MSFKIAIDAGHGLRTPGKRCSVNFDPHESPEWLLNSRIAEKLQVLLSAYDVEILRVDDPTGYTDMPLETRTKKANQFGADFYISIHHNAGGGSGLEVYRYWLCFSKSETAQWQNVIYDSLINAGVPKGTRAQGKQTANFQVLRDTKMNAILCEMGFMDNVIDTPLILTEDFANKAAQGLCNAIVSRANLQSKSIQPNVETAPQEQPVAETSAPVVKSIPYAVYQVYTKVNKWLPNVVNDSDFAGFTNRAIQALYVNLSDGSVQYQVHTVGGKWLSWVTDRQDYAGVFGKNIDAVRVKLADTNNYSVQCRVAPIGGGYYPWVTDNNDYAGSFGKAIDRIQIRIINK